MIQNENMDIGLTFLGAAVLTLVFAILVIIIWVFYPTWQLASVAGVAIFATLVMVLYGGMKIANAQQEGVQ